jgi:uncharacterized protein
MKKKYKIIRDSIYGDIRIEGIFQKLLESPEIQRLSSIKQLGLAHLIFPGAHHTRLEHSLGAFYMATAMANNLSLSENERLHVLIAALLHDIGHGPFSHTLESLLREQFDVDHVDLTVQLINGDYEIFQKNEKINLLSTETVSDLLSSNDFDKKLIIDIIQGKESTKPYLGELLNSVIDADQIDYLLRDSYYTGVAYGMIDSQRFVQTLQIHNGHLALDRKGVGVIENVLMARALMYSSVYFHKTVRIAELMLSKAFELIPDIKPFAFFSMTDGELIEVLKNNGLFQEKIVTRLKYRQLFKQAYHYLDQPDDEDSKMDLIKQLENATYRRRIEQIFEETLDIPKGHIIIDVPSFDLHQAEPRIQEIDMPINDNGTIKALTHFTPVAKAIGMRSIPDWDIMIITDEPYRKKVNQYAEQLLFND